ncbi:MAG: TIM barrel protein [Armatimonadota bacterium]|jgi:sugar phosphate isomerase/epimerase
MRLGGHIYGDTSGPESWIAAVKASGYTAGYCPVGNVQDDDAIEAYAKAAADADIVIAEVGAWSNPMSPDDEERRKAQELCKERLTLADKIGARCCVNIAGSRGEEWAGHHPDNLTEETFDLIVEVTREIIDAVKPTRTHYTLEMMAWVFPDSADSYARLLEAVERPQCAVHLDPVNIVSSPRLFYSTGDLIRECFAKLGPHIKSCHAKDIALSQQLTVHLDEVRPGLGGLDYATYLTELDKLDPDTPLMIEHLSSEEEYELAADHIRSVADDVGVTIR